MAQWIITYSKDNNTSTLDMQADHKPEMEEAVTYLLDWARSHLEKGEFGDGQDKQSTEPAVNTATTHSGSSWKCRREFRSVRTSPHSASGSVTSPCESAAKT